MKFRSIILSALCGLAVSTAMTSCSDDDEYDPFAGGSKVALPENLGYILNQGSMGMNNANIVHFDWKADTLNLNPNVEHDLYFIQNGKNLGDTGQDMIMYEGNLYVVVYGSSYVVKLNRACVEQTRKQIPANYGQPRYIVAKDGSLYVTCLGGYVVKLSANDLSEQGKVTVGHTPERIDEEDGMLYVAQGNSYDPYPDTKADNRIAIVDTKNFTDGAVKYVDVMPNTQMVVANDNYVAVQGYGYDWTNTPLWIYNIKTGKAEDTGECCTYMAKVDGSDKFFCVYSMTDWSTYETHNTYFYYDPATKTKQDITEKIRVLDATLLGCSIYGLSAGKDGSYYILNTYYSAGNGRYFHVYDNFQHQEIHSTWGQNPCKVVLDD